ncbi:hypothetical protein PTTG_00481 [Puccinia triticina 1-1 BBBD Race 1]|uniref:Uncharacterized protein n=2 Tax=Puccinia triticina TaxID=208348 RepID=A0A180H5N4_PUCT1|nr:uncharacterized protein PtA15_2A555 [Puccinia triticina]OAV99743.1 hypothetical protein PTTG_00481 [Puccinia triticina 1-1 BBBD Race 1]WAQ82238.1 hypothetical protein PtA15_2A555 [Puccinia triticina]WAR53091.1 hypothetical protein PtB15_2B521 [Puccinia triticina]
MDARPTTTDLVTWSDGGLHIPISDSTPHHLQAARSRKQNYHRVNILHSDYIITTFIDTMAAEDNSFVKQSLTETLTGPSASARLAPKPTLGKTRRLINSKDMASRKAKADEESGGILKSLGLTPTARRAHKSSPDKQEAVTDWEEVENLDGIAEPNSLHPFDPSPSKAHHSSRPLSGSQESTKPSKSDPDSMHLKSQYQSSSDPPNNHRQSSPKSSESTLILNLRRQLAESQTAREELALQNTKLERELIELKGDNKAKADGKLLGAREYQELERQFDEQEKLLSGYQRENERSLIELEATKVKMTKMSNLLAKVYGPDWEETIPSMNDSSPGGTMKQNSLPARIQSSPSTINSTAIPNTPSEKLSLQLAQVQLLVQGMERRLVSREAELEDLHKQTKLEHLSIQESLNRSLPKPHPPQSSK